MPRAPRISIALTAGTALAFEVLLTRLFAIVQWHHFAHMAISIALLGFGASGTFLALSPGLLRHFRATYLVNLVLFALAVVPSFLVAQRFAVNPEALLWEPRQMFGVSVVYLSLALPFFFAANAIGLSLMCFRGDETRLYAADLVGAGIGSLAVVALLYVVFPAQALLILGVLALLGSVVGAWEVGVGRAAIALLTALGSVVVILLIVSGWQPQLTLSPYKALATQLAVMGAEIEHERSSPLGLLSVVRSPNVPLRHAPGLSLVTHASIPEQRAIYIDGDGPTTIDAAAEPGDASHDYLDALPSALPYHLAHPQRVAVLGAGGGRLVRQALAHRAQQVFAVERNPQIVALLRGPYHAFSGRLYARDEVILRIQDTRAFAVDHRDGFDLIQLESADSFSASAAGVLALDANYLDTVEALETYYRALTPDGMLATHRWVRLPPRDVPKLFATAVAALKRLGAQEPGRQLLLIRGWQSATLLIKRGHFSPAEIEAAKRFCDRRSFDLVFHHGMVESEANRHNRLAEPFHHRLAVGLLEGNSERLVENYKFDIRPATDDRPFHQHFFRWRTLPELWSLMGAGGVSLLESGFILLIATLVQAILLGLVLIAFPLWRHRHSDKVRVSRLLWYFIALGLGFLFIEIAFIQKFLLFLKDPVIAVASVLAGFLVFAGLGSALAAHLQERLGARCIARSALIVTAMLAPIYFYLLPELVFEPLASTPLALRTAVAVGLVGILAIPMGMPFPLALSRLDQQAPSAVALAWAINGCASVISAVLAVLLAMHFGFTVVVVIAAALYLSAVPVFDH